MQGRHHHCVTHLFTKLRISEGYRYVEIETYIKLVSVKGVKTLGIEMTVSLSAETPAVKIQYRAKQHSVGIFALIFLLRRDALYNV